MLANGVAVAGDAATDACRKSKIHVVEVPDAAVRTTV